MSTTQQNDKFNQWAIVELFGRQKIAGLVSEATLAGGAFIRVDVPACGGQKAYTRFFGPSAIYGISPCEEKIARDMVEQCGSEPVHRYQLPMLVEGKPDKDDDSPGYTIGSGDPEGD